MFFGSYNGNVKGLRKIAKDLLDNISMEDLSQMSDSELMTRVEKAGWVTLVEYDDAEQVYFIKKEDLNGMLFTVR